jgi:HicB family
MKMSLVVDGLRSDVVSVGELGDDQVAALAERIADVLARSLPSRILELLSDVAAELSAELPDGRVEIRLAGDDVELAFVADEPARGAAPEPDGELAARITLRVSEGLKARVEERAASEGVSVNAFIVRTLDRTTSAQRGAGWSGGSRTRNRLRGYGST